MPLAVEKLEAVRRDPTALPRLRSASVWLRRRPGGLRRDALVGWRRAIALRIISRDDGVEFGQEYLFQQIGKSGSTATTEK